MRHKDILKAALALGLVSTIPLGASAFDIVNGGAYRIVSENYPKGTVVLGSNYGNSSAICTFGEAADDQYDAFWVFDKASDGQYYIYNSYYFHYMAWTASSSTRPGGVSRNGTLSISNNPDNTCLWKVTEVENGVFQIGSAYENAAGNTYWNQTSTANTQWGTPTYDISLGSSASSGTRFFLVDKNGVASTETVEPEPEIPSIVKPDAKLLPNAYALDQLADEALSAYNHRCGRETLVNDGSQLYCGFGQNDLGTKTDGDDITAIIDDNPATYFHSYWESASIPAGSHYFYVMADEANYGPFEGTLTVDITRRVAVNDHASQFTVYGTNDKPSWGYYDEYGTAYPFKQASWEPIAVLDLPNPTSGAEISVSLAIPEDKSYTALKFACTGQNNATGRCFFHLAEFQLSDYAVTPDCDNAAYPSEAAAFLQAITDARAAVTAAVESGNDCSAAAISTLQAALAAYRELFKGESADLVINEFQVANVDQTLDPSYNYGSWIELYNAGSSSVDLSGYTLTHTDSDGLVETYTFADGNVGSVPAHGYKVVWFDHNSADGFFGKHADNQVRFKLDCDGGMLDLADADGTLVATLLYEEAIPRCSYARTTDGGTQWRWTANPTPGDSNRTSTFADTRLAAPVVSGADAGIFYGSVSLNVAIPSGTQLLYTTDGSTPTRGGASTSIAPNGAFSFYETTVFRCCLVADGYLPSPVVTRSYIKHNTRDYYLPIVSIVTDPRHLYDDEIGVYCTGTNGRVGNAEASDGTARNWNMDWERPVNVEYLVPQTDATSTSGTTYATAFNMGSNFEICGGWSRKYGEDWDKETYRHWEMKSSFRLKGDKCFEGQNSFDYPIFPHQPYRKYKSLQIRNGGNDTQVRTWDVAVQSPFLASNFYLDTQDAQPAHIFFNGEFLGTFNIRESNNKAYGYSGYGIKSDDIDAFEIHSEKPNYEQKAGDKAALERWMELAQQLASNADRQTGFAESNATNDAIWAEILTLVDITEYANYFAAELNMGPGDWLNNPNNCKGFRDRRDGKFHFTMFDVDSAWAYGSGDLFSGMMGGSCKTEISDLFRNMIKYRPFMRLFADTWAIINGSVLSEDNVRNSINAYTSLTADAMAFEYNNSSTATISKGNGVIGNHLNYKSNHISTLSNYYGLSTYDLSVSANIPGARLLVNNLEMPISAFDGQLYAPATLTALAPAGYTFTGWCLDGYSGTGIGSGSSSDKVETTIIPEADTWSYYDQGSADGTGWKNLDFYGKWDSAKAPFGYGNFSYNTTLDYGGNAQNKRPTYYFRHEFTLDDEPASTDVYTVTYRVDDGCVIYINGKAVGSHLMASENPAYSDLATNYDRIAPYQGTITVPYSAFQQGRNVITAEVHNNVVSSSDIFFDASLTLVQTTSSGSTTEPEEPDVDPSNILSRNQNLQLADLPYGASQRYNLVATYRRLADVKVAPVRVNEVSANNKVYADHDNWERGDWVELYNMTDEPVDVAGMYLSDNATSPQKWAIPAKGTAGSQAETVIAPHSTLIIWCDKLLGSKQLHAPFKLSNADGCVVTLRAADGSWTDRLDYNIDPSHGTASYGRYPDGSDNVYYMERATIAKANSMLFGQLDLDALAYDYPTDEAPVPDEFDLQLAAGWNWLSHPLSTAQPVSLFTDGASVIRSQKDEVINDDTYGWVGTLTALEPARGYKAQYGKAASVHLTGTLFDAAATPVSLKAGWNWVGCPLANATETGTALEGLSAAEGDAIVGLSGFSTYTDGAWKGSLTTLAPGQGYLLHTAAAQRFSWNALTTVPSQRRLAREADDVAAPWAVDVHAYPNVMSLVATLDDSRFTDAALEGLTLAAFASVNGELGECRGVATVIDGRFYLNIHGDDAESLSFVVLDASGETYSANETLTFAPQTLVGSHAAPFALTLSGTVTAVDLALAGDVTETAIYTPSGQRIARMQPGVNIVATHYANGQTRITKVTVSE